jgi:excisionase family DNA binding protein
VTDVKTTITASPEITENEWISVKEAALYLKVGKATIYRWAREGKLTLYQFGKRTIRIKRSEIDSMAIPKGENGRPVAHTRIPPGDFLKRCQELTDRIRERRGGKPAGESAAELREIRLERAKR